MKRRRPKPQTALARARSECGITQQDLAAELGIKQPSYSAIESGKVVPSVLQAQKIARLVCREVSDLWPVLDAPKAVAS